MQHQKLEKNDLSKQLEFWGGNLLNTSVDQEGTFPDNLFTDETMELVTNN